MSTLRFRAVLSSHEELLRYSPMLRHGFRKPFHFRDHIMKAPSRNMITISFSTLRPQQLVLREFRREGAGTSPTARDQALPRRLRDGVCTVSLRTSQRYPTCMVVILPGHESDSYLPLPRFSLIRLQSTRVIVSPSLDSLLLITRSPISIIPHVPNQHSTSSASACCTHVIQLSVWTAIRRPL